MNKLPVGILLAAGQSRRFGSNKLLYPVIDNTPMLMVTAKKLVSVLSETICVINQEMTPYTNELELLGMQVIINEHAHCGIGSSISCSIAASQAASGWLITLADMPYIEINTIEILANKIKDGAEIVAPVYEHQRGHPVGFNQRFKDELMALNDDVGARHVIAKNINRFGLIPTRDKGVITDIDYKSSNRNADNILSQ